MTNPPRKNDALKSKSRGIKILLNGFIPFEAVRDNLPHIFATIFMVTHPLNPPPLVREGEDFYIKRGFAPLKHPFPLCPGSVLLGDI